MPPSEPNAFDLASSFAAELDDAPADERVYRVAIQLHEPARVAEIAERADCAPDTARRHLERLAEMGVLDRVSDDPAVHRRNESYFEWRKRERLADLPSSQLADRLADLTGREAAFREQFDADDPSDVDALSRGDYDQLDDVWMDLSEWRTVRRRIQRLEAVRGRRTGESRTGSKAD